MSWITRLFGRATQERDLDRELQFHLDAAVADHMRAGLTREAALRKARIELGGLDQVKEEARDARGTRWIEDLIADVRYAVRGMRRSPAFTAAAILTLALGIGANTAVGTILEALMLRTLPITRPRELYAVRRDGNDNDNSKYLVSYDRFRRLQATLPDSSRLAAMSEIVRMYAAIGDSPEAIEAQLVSAEWFSLLGVRPVVGRLISAEDCRSEGGHPVAVLGAAFWRTRYAGDPGIVGKTIRANGLTLTIIGVADDAFQSLTLAQPVALWAPLMEQHQIKYRGNVWSSNADTEKPWVPQPGIEWLTMVTRAEAGAAGGVEQRLDALFRADLRISLAQRDSAARAYGMREHLVLESISRGFSSLRNVYKDPLKLLMGSVGLVLLIACGNLAGLMIARGATRTHEMSVRVSLGARPGRLVRQVMTESLTLAALGGALSLLVAKWGSAALVRAASSGPRSIPLDVALGWRVLLFTIVVALATGALFSLAPAVRIARADMYEAFRSGGRVLGRGSHRLPLGRVLVVSQIALSLVLVTSAGLFVRTLQSLLALDPGFKPEHVLTARVDVRAAGYAYAQLPALHQRLLEAVGAVPGVRSASLSLDAIAGNSRRTSGFTIPGRELTPPERSGQENYVSPAYFETIGIPLLRGRSFKESDRDGSAPVAIISRTAARHFFGTEDVVGKRFGYDTPQFEIVGVVEDSRFNSIRERPRRLVYYPLAQGPQEYISSVEARVAGPSDAIVSGVRKAVAAVDHNLPLREVVTIRALLERGLTRERLVARLAGSFAVLALLLAGVGLYGVIGYSVSRRTNEMGVRMALGSSPAGVGWLVLRDSLATIGVGLLVGLLLWLPLSGLTGKLVFGVAPRDAVTLAGALLLLTTVGAIAALLPALRAARVDPVEAIRAE